MITISSKAVSDEEEIRKEPESMSKVELEREIRKVMKQMNEAATELNFERAALLRDRMLEYKKHLQEIEDDE